MTIKASTNIPCQWCRHSIFAHGKIGDTGYCTDSGSEDRCQCKHTPGDILEKNRQEVGAAVGKPVTDVQLPETGDSEAEDRAELRAELRRLWVKAQTCRLRIRKKRRALEDLELEIQQEELELRRAEYALERFRQDKIGDDKSV